MDEIKNIIEEVKEFLSSEKFEMIKRYHSYEELEEEIEEEIVEAIEKMKSIVKKLKKIRDLNQYEGVISGMELFAIISTFEEELIRYGVYQGKDVCFEHDIRLDKNYSFDENIKIVDETTGNEININFMDISHFAHLITETTKENICREDRIWHPENYERKEIPKEVVERPLPMPRTISDERAKELSLVHMNTSRHFFP